LLSPNLAAISEGFLSELQRRQLADHCKHGLHAQLMLQRPKAFMGHLPLNRISSSVLRLLKQFKKFFKSYFGNFG